MKFRGTCRGIEYDEIFLIHEGRGIGTYISYRKDGKEVLRSGHTSSEKAIKMIEQKLQRGY